MPRSKFTDVEKKRSNTLLGVFNEVVKTYDIPKIHIYSAIQKKLKRQFPDITKSSAQTWSRGISFLNDEQLRIAKKCLKKIIKKQEKVKKQDNTDEYIVDEVDNEGFIINVKKVNEEKEIEVDEDESEKVVDEEEKETEVDEDESEKVVDEEEKETEVDEEEKETEVDEEENVKVVNTIEDIDDKMKRMKDEVKSIREKNIKLRQIIELKSILDKEKNIMKQLESKIYKNDRW